MEYTFAELVRNTNQQLYSQEFQPSYIEIRQAFHALAQQLIARADCEVFIKATFREVSSIGGSMIVGMINTGQVRKTVL